MLPIGSNVKGGSVISGKALKVRGLDDENRVLREVRRLGRATGSDEHALGPTSCFWQEWSEGEGGERVRVPVQECQRVPTF
jgi:hypothetical protein